MRTKFTETNVAKLPAPASGQMDHYDALLPSFGVRVSHTGARSFFVMDRVGGKLKRMTIGRVGSLTLADARQKARDWKAEAANGVDPVAAQAEREAEDAKREADLTRTTFSAVAGQYLDAAENRLRPATLRDYRRVLTGDAVEAWKDKQLTILTRSDVSAILDALDERGLAASSNHALAAFRAFFNWTVERGLLERSPVERVRARHPHAKRDRVLQPAELAIVLAALGDDAAAKVFYGIELPYLPDLFKDFYRALILTGQRRGEVAAMSFGEVHDLDDADNARWLIPSARTKNKREHIVPLSPAMIAILKQRRTVAEARAKARGERQREIIEPTSYIFAGQRYVPLSGFSKAKRELDARVSAICKAIGRPALADWTAHDLRRTFVTLVSEEVGTPPHVVEAIVNHVSGATFAGVAGVYNRALYLAERREALNAWADYVAGLEATPPHR